MDSNKKEKIEKIKYYGIGRGRGAPYNPFDEWGTHPLRQLERLSVKDEPSENVEDRSNVTRPKKLVSKEGTKGDEITLRANYFRLENTPEFKFTLYRVDFNPEVDEEVVRKRLINELKPQLGAYVFDGQNMIYLTHKLPEKEIKYVCHDENRTRLIARETGQEIHATDRMALQIYNLILRRTIGSFKLERIGRNMYDPQASVKISEHNLELWPGYITSIRHHENNNMLVACEVSHKVMRRETVLDLMKNIIKDKGSSSWQDEFKKEILGKTVLTGYNNKTYKIDDVKFDINPLSTFDCKGTEKTFKEYFVDRYGLQVRDDRQPMLVSNPKKKDQRDIPILLIPELCRTSGLTDKMKSNFQLMRAMSQHTQVDPENRRSRLIAFMNRIRNNQESKNVMNSWNINIDNDLVKIRGRALQQESIIFGNDKQIKNDDRVDWTNGLRSNKMITDVPLKRWVVIYPKKLTKETETFSKILLEVCEGMNYEAFSPKFIEIPSDRIDAYTTKVEEIKGMEPRLIMIILSTAASDKYAAIKRQTCIDACIPTQIILGKTITPKPGANPSALKSVATKVAIQLNCKLGGAPWSIKFPVQGIMCIGVDIIRDTKNRNQFYASLIASMDITKKVEFFSHIMKYQNHAELSSNITYGFFEALKAFKAAHGSLPEKIILYRDGVGEGDISDIFHDEIPQLKSRVNDWYDNYEKGTLLKMSYIIVNKRINTKIFREQGTKLSNPLPGSIVDNTITLPERYDFFLISQSVRQGTVSPTSYNIIHDETEWSPDHLQSLTYKMCHLYFNWSGTVRVPAVLQYARKLAILTGEHLHEVPSGKFGNKLFYL